MGAKSSKAVVIPINGALVVQWPLLCTVFDVMMRNCGGYKLLDGKKFFKKKRTMPMYFGDDLKPGRVYFLLPVKEDGSFNDDGPELHAQPKNIKRTMGRGGKNLITPVFAVSTPN